MPVPSTDRLTTNAAAEYLGVSYHWLAKQRPLGKGPAYHQLGKKNVFYTVPDLDDFIAAGRVVPSGRKPQDLGSVM